ncbi:MAG: CoA transferase [Gammaproteobacteria bacterium]
MNEIYTALNLKETATTVGEQRLPSCFAVSELAASSIAAVGCAIANLQDALNLVNTQPAIQVDRRLASLWFAQSVHPIDWQLPPVWDAIAGDYETSNGWIRIHTNLPHHRVAALQVLETDYRREKVKQAMLTWQAGALETEIVNNGGVAAAMRSRDDWMAHPQGKAVASESLIDWGETRQGKIRPWQPRRSRPLNGLRILDLTRVLAGPVASRTLAGFGAEVLRIDPPAWDEPGVVPDISLGKRCCSLDLNQRNDRHVFEELLARADLLIHGYRPDALSRLGYDPDTRLRIAPALIEVSLNAYGWTGPWSRRRGFDSLVQMSCGIANSGMEWARQDRPTPLPVQALDHATGYLMAAAAIRAISMAISADERRSAHLSLARTAELLCAYPQDEDRTLTKEPLPRDFSNAIEATSWGKAHRLKPALSIAGTPMEWGLPACELGSSPAAWLS